MTIRKGGDSSVGYEDSWYYHSAHPAQDFPSLSQPVESTVCIIGAGYTGLSAALELQQNGVDTVVLESYKIGAGASGRNGGVLGSGQRKDQGELEAWLGKDDARKMWQIAEQANQLVRDRIAKFNIDCDLRDGELTVAHRQRHEAELWAYAELLEKNYGDTNLRLVDRQEVSDMLGVDSFHGGYVDSRAGHLHPLNLARGLAQAAHGLGAKLFEHSKALSYKTEGDKVIVATETGTVRADYLIIACNGYLGDLDRQAERYQMPINNFILATEPLGEDLARSINRDNLAVVDTRFVVNYFHNSPDHRLIFGGGENYSSRFPSDIKAFVRKHMLQVYPQLHDCKIDFAWGGTLAITMRRMPHFGRKERAVYWAQGYSGHGIAMANMGGKLVADAIMGKAEHFDLFAGLKHIPFPGARLLRWPGLVAGMLYYSILDRF